MPGIKSIDRGNLRNNIIALAKIASRTKMPTVLTSNIAQGINGAILPEIITEFPGSEDYRPEQADHVGHTTDVCLVFPAVQAAKERFEVYCVLDASGAWSKRAEEASSCV